MTTKQKSTAPAKKQGGKKPAAPSATPKKPTEEYPDAVEEAAREVFGDLKRMRNGYAYMKQLQDVWDAIDKHEKRMAKA